MCYRVWISTVISLSTYTVLLIGLGLYQFTNWAIYDKHGQLSN